MPFQAAGTPTLYHTCFSGPVAQAALVSPVRLSAGDAVNIYRRVSCRYEFTSYIKDRCPYCCTEQEWNDEVSEEREQSDEPSEGLDGWCDK